jgi:haloalkane dehalogenase
MNTAACHQQRRFSELPGGRIAYIERGSGPATLFLHGLPLCGYQWRGVIEDLAPVRR